MLRWLAQLSLFKVVALALAWPIALLIGSLAMVGRFVIGRLRIGDPFSVGFSAEPLLSIVVWGPTLVILSAWAFARHRHRSAT